MKQSYISIDGIGDLKITRSNKSRSIRIRITPEGQPSVSAPSYVPIIAIKQFVRSKKTWILQNSRPPKLISEDSIIGKHHKILIEKSDKLSARLKDDHILLKKPQNLSLLDKGVQDLLKKYAIKALRHECEQYMPAKLSHWQGKGVGTFKRLNIKKITSRWGSYSSEGTVNLSLYCAQLPNNLIDYIIVHELAHSRHLNHSKAFWNHVASYYPNYKLARNELKKYHMSINPS